MPQSFHSNCPGTPAASYGVRKPLSGRVSFVGTVSEYLQASEPPFAGFRATLSTYLQASEPPLYIVCPRFSFSAPLHELSWRFPAICHVGFHGIKAYLSIAAHACERFAQCSNTIYSMTDIAKLPGNAAQPSCSGFEKENLPPDSRLWRLYPNPHIVCPMLSSLQISGWL